MTGSYFIVEDRGCGEAFIKDEDGDVITKGICGLQFDMDPVSEGFTSLSMSLWDVWEILWRQTSILSAFTLANSEVHDDSVNFSRNYVRNYCLKKKK